jgi:hypothetical protein
MDKITLAGGENAKGDALYQLDKDLENFRWSTFGSGRNHC